VYFENKICILRIKSEIKFVCQNFIQNLYHEHLTVTNTWVNNWTYIENTIYESVKTEFNYKYQNLNQKINKYIDFFSCGAAAQRGPELPHS